MSLQGWKSLKFWLCEDICMVHIVTFWVSHLALCFNCDAFISIEKNIRYLLNRKIMTPVFANCKTGGCLNALISPANVWMLPHFYTATVRACVRVHPHTSSLPAVPHFSLYVVLLSHMETWIICTSQYLHSLHLYYLLSVDYSFALWWMFSSCMCIHYIPVFPPKRHKVYP